MKSIKKTLQLLRDGEAKKWQYKFKQILGWLNEPVSVLGSHAQRLHRIQEAREALERHEHEELYMKQSVYVSVFCSHLEAERDKYEADLLESIKTGALTDSTLGECVSLAHRWTYYNLDLMELLAYVEKVGAAFPELFKQSALSID